MSAEKNFGIAPSVKECAEDVLTFLYKRNDPIFFTPELVTLVLRQAIDWIDSTPMVSPLMEHELANNYREKFSEPMTSVFSK